MQEMVTHPVAGRKIQGGSLCPQCGHGIMCINGLISADLSNYVTNCWACGVVLCSKCGRKAHALEGGTYICSYCRGGIEVLLAFPLDAERVYLSLEEAHANGEPLPEADLIICARAKLFAKNGR